MLIMYLALGFACGIIAAVASLMAGAGILAAFGAYVVGGLIGAVLGGIWALLPQRTNNAKHSATQQSWY